MLITECTPGSRSSNKRSTRAGYASARSTPAPYVCESPTHSTRFAAPPPGTRAVPHEQRLFRHHPPAARPHVRSPQPVRPVIPLRLAVHTTTRPGPSLCSVQPPVVRAPAGASVRARASRAESGEAKRRLRAIRWARPFSAATGPQQLSQRPPPLPIIRTDPLRDLSHRLRHRLRRLLSKLPEQQRHQPWIHGPARTQRREQRPRLPIRRPITHNRLRHTVRPMSVPRSRAATSCTQCCSETMWMSCPPLRSSIAFSIFRPGSRGRDRDRRQRTRIQPASTASHQPHGEGCVAFS